MLCEYTKYIGWVMNVEGKKGREKREMDTIENINSL
jgi:hypothetical protein